MFVRGEKIPIFAVLTAFARSDIFESVFALSLTENVAVFKVAGQRTALISCSDHGNRCVLRLYIPISIQVWGIASSFIFAWVRHNLLKDKRNQLHTFFLRISRRIGVVRQ